MSNSPQPHVRWEKKVGEQHLRTTNSQKRTPACTVKHPPGCFIFPIGSIYTFQHAKGHMSASHPFCSRIVRILDLTLVLLVLHIHSAVVNHQTWSFSKCHALTLELISEGPYPCGSAAQDIHQHEVASRGK